MHNTHSTRGVQQTLKFETLVLFMKIQTGPLEWNWTFLRASKIIQNNIPEKYETQLPENALTQMKGKNYNVIIHVIIAPSSQFLVDHTVTECCPKFGTNPQI